MMIAGGICFILIGLLNENSQDRMSFISQMVVSSVIISGVEFLTGVIVNLWLGLNVWDYSNKPYNVLGQICLLYVSIWFFLSPLDIIADDYLRYWLICERRSKYRFW
ncbi:putative ABC transporter permease [Anaerosporobacter sp.]